MKFKFRGKKYKYTPTEWQKCVLGGIVGLAMVISFYYCWIAEQILLSK